MADENQVKIADKLMALMREASADEMAKTLFMLKLPAGVRTTMWAEPIAMWTEMKARARALWHAARTKPLASSYQSASIRKPVTGPYVQAGNGGAGHL